MILRDALDIRRGTAQRNKIYKGTYKVWDRNKIALEGYCKQNTTTGNNLWNKANDMTNIATSANNAILTKNIDSISCKITGESIGGFYIGAPIFNSYIDGFNSSTKYYISADITTSEKIIIKFGFENNATTLEVEGTKRVTGSSGSSGSGNTAFVFYGYTHGSTITISNIQVCSVADYDFEPYTGGQPSPSPDYPQEIEVMQGRQVVNIKSRNLIGIGTQLNGFRNLDTNRFNSNANSVGYYFSTELLPDTITFNCVGGNRANISYYNEIPAQGVESLQYSNSNIVPRTITVDKNYKYIHIQLSYNILDISKIQLEEGTEATSWVPYKNEQYTVDLKSKNLLRQDQYVTTRTINGITFTNNGDGTFNITGTATAVTTINFLNGTSQIGLRSGKTYYLYSSQPYNAITFNLSIIFLQDGVRRYLITNSKITTSGEISDMKLAFYIESGNTVNAQNVKLMLVEGSTATDTDYEPYYDYKLAGIGDYKDNFYTDKGKWYLKKNIGEHNLIGQMAGAGVNNAFFTTEINDYALADNIPYSNRFKGISNINGAGALTNADDNVISFINSTDYIRFYIKSTKFADYNAMNEFLTNNKTYIYYLLKQPITTEITAPTLINQLNALYQAM